MNLLSSPALAEFRVEEHTRHRRQAQRDPTGPNVMAKWRRPDLLMMQIFDATGAKTTQARWGHRRLRTVLKGY